jgi:hypothetical protein
MTDNTTTASTHAWDYPVVLTHDQNEISVAFHYPNNERSWTNCKGKTHPQLYHFQPSHIKGMAHQLLAGRKLEEGDTYEKLLRRCAVVNELHDRRNKSCKYEKCVRTGQITFTFASKQGTFYKTLTRRLSGEGIYHEIQDKLALNPETTRRLGVVVVADLTAPSAWY